LEMPYLHLFPRPMRSWLSLSEYLIPRATTGWLQGKIPMLDYKKMTKGTSLVS
jgi:hypothetical protein